MMFEIDHIARITAWPAAWGLPAILLIMGLGGCSVAITNQPPSPGGCVGEPARTRC